jgi:LacI family transcriptional regulator
MTNQLQELMTSASDTSGNARKRVRMRDVANRCGVSISTVSLVLSGDPRIPEDTARRVLQAVKAMEYRPSVLARSLARRVSRTIGVIVPEYAFTGGNQPFYYSALQGIHSQTQPAGYKIVVEGANKVFLERRYHLRLLKEQSADGMIYLAASVNDPYLTEVEKESYPFVLLASNAENVNLPCVKSDDYLGAKIATQHLISLGHKVIGHLAGSTEHSNGRDREKGYRDAMAEAGLPVKPEWVRPGNYDLETSLKATGELLTQNVTAIFAASDVMAYGAMRGAQDRGLNVPADLALVGMDDLEMSRYVNPTLTTVRYDITQLASIAARFIIKQVQSPLVSKNILTEVPKPELVIRASCGARK